MSELDVTREALLALRSQYLHWLDLQHTTLAERRLAQTKIALIDVELGEGIMADGIEELDLTVRAYNVLKREGINTIGEVVKLSVGEVLDMRNMGEGGLRSVQDRLTAHGLKLRED